MKSTMKRRFVMPTAADDRGIVAAARRDPDAQPLTTAQLKTMVPLKTLCGRRKG